MIRERVGNLVAAEENILVFMDKKGGLLTGIVGKQIRECLVNQRQYEDIQEAVERKDHPFYFEKVKNGKAIAGIFSGDATTLKTALECIKRLAHYRSIALPGYLGCNGNHDKWDKTFDIILDVFKDYRSDVTIYYSEENAQRLKAEFEQVPKFKDKELPALYIMRSWHGFPAMTRMYDIKEWFDRNFKEVNEQSCPSYHGDTSVLHACKVLVDGLYPAKFQEQRNWLEEQIHILTPYHEEETPEGILKILDAMKGLATLYGKDLEEKPETEEEAEEHTEEVTEVCSHCDSEVTLPWDIAESGYKAFCPYCGNRLMLCAYCPRQKQCDYDKETDTCYYNPKD